MATQEHYWTPEENPNLLDALRIQIRVIGALVIRELRTRFWKNRFGYAWALMEPCLHIGVWYIVTVMVKERQGKMGMSPLLIIASGLCPMFLFRGTTNFIASSIRSNQTLLRYPVVKHIDVILARFILEAATTVSVGLIIFSFLIAIDVAPVPRDPLGLFAPCGALLLLGLGTGTLFSVFSKLSNTVYKFTTVIMVFIYFTSGIYYLGGYSLPPQAMEALSYNPVYNAVEVFRIAYFHNFRDEYVSVWYTLEWAAGTMLSGLILEVAASEKLSDK